MKTCLNCGRSAANNAINCEHCGRAFAYQSDAADGEPVQASTSARPDGSGLKSFGGIVFALGMMALLGGWFYSESEYSFSDIDPSRVALKANLLLLGGALMQIGAVAWLVGHVVEAISFLPGKDEK